jgi:hypothetical protein
VDVKEGLTKEGEMPRITIKDLPKDFKFSREEMRRIAGGAETIHLYRRAQTYRLDSDEVGQASIQFGNRIAGARLME